MEAVLVGFCGHFCVCALLLLTPPVPPHTANRLTLLQNVSCLAILGLAMAIVDRGNRRGIDISLIAALPYHHPVSSSFQCSGRPLAADFSLAPLAGLCMAAAFGRVTDG